jgi:hypothetical protein
VEVANTVVIIKSFHESRDICPDFNIIIERFLNIGESPRPNSAIICTSGGFKIGNDNLSRRISAAFAALFLLWR